MSSRGGMVGGVNCKSGLIYGQYIILQNSYEMTDLSLSEVFVYGIWALKYEFGRLDWYKKNYAILYNTLPLFSI